MPSLTATFRPAIGLSNPTCRPCGAAVAQAAGAGTKPRTPVAGRWGLSRPRLAWPAQPWRAAGAGVAWPDRIVPFALRQRLATIAASPGLGQCGGQLARLLGEPNLLARSYHSGASEDLAEVVAHLHAQRPLAPLYAVGYSLGGNVLLKYLGKVALPASCKLQWPFRCRFAWTSAPTALVRVFQCIKRISCAR